MAGSHARNWTAADVPDQHGRTAVVTGANTGIGFETAKVLAERGATVVLACRDAARADHAATQIHATAPAAALSILELDLASLDSVRRAAEQLRATYPRVDLLINNAGVMSPAHLRTADGFELQFGTNHLGPFGFTGPVLDQLVGVPGSRVVTVSSGAHRRGRITFDDLQSEQRFRWFAAYARSKLANLMFTYELQRRLTATGMETVAVAAHPGNAYTDLVRNFPGWIQTIIGRPALRWATRWWFQSPHLGALATLRAAVDPQARGGEFYGPAGWWQFKGHPVRVEPAVRARDSEAQRRLWEESERLTGVVYRLAGVP